MLDEACDMNHLVLAIFEIELRCFLYFTVYQEPFKSFTKTFINVKKLVFMFLRLTPLEPDGTSNYYQASKKYKIMGEDLEKQRQNFFVGEKQIFYQTCLSLFSRVSQIWFKM